MLRRVAWCVLVTPRSRTDTQSIESEVEPALVVALLTDPRRLPEWAPAFADAVEAGSGTGWRVRKDGREFALRVALNEDAGTVDYLREVAPGREGGAYLRVIARPGGGSVIVMTVPRASGADSAAASSTLLEELGALSRLVAAEQR